jgi:hypothetical protein
MINLNEYQRLISRTGDAAELLEKDANMKGRLLHAKQMFAKARRRRDSKAMLWWKQVYHNTKQSLGGGEGGGSAGGGGFAQKLMAKSKKAAKAFADLPKSSKKFFSDPKFRKKVAKEVGDSFRRKASHAVAHVKEEAKEFKEAGGAIRKYAKGESLSSHDKAALKKAAKAVALTVAGTVAMGGLSHLTVAALAKHFAAETAVKAVAKAAVLVDSLQWHGGVYLTEATLDEKVMEAWTRRLIEAVADKLEGLAEMDEDEISGILEKIA